MLSRFLADYHKHGYSILCYATYCLTGDSRWKLSGWNSQWSNVEERQMIEQFCRFCALLVISELRDTQDIFALYRKQPTNYLMSITSLCYAICVTPAEASVEEKLLAKKMQELVEFLKARHKIIITTCLQKAN